MYLSGIPEGDSFMKLKHYTASLIPICLVVFVFRAVELILTIDPRTGHFTSGSILPTVFNVALVAVSVFFLTVMFGKREPKPAVVRLYRPSMFDLITGCLGSVFLVAAALRRLITQIGKETLQLNGKLFLSAEFWQLFFAVFSALFLIFLVTYPKRTAKNNGWKILSLFLTAYHVFMLLDLFRDLDVVFSRAFGIYSITYYGLATLACINLSKILARLFGRKAFTFFTCLMTVLMTVRLADTVLYLIPENPYAIPGDLLLFAADALITLLFLSQAKKLMKGKKRRRPAPEEPQEQEPAPGAEKPLSE